MARLDARTDRLLRNDIRRLGEQLGDTLVRLEGRQFLELVEEVRRVAKAVRAGEAGSDELRSRLGHIDLPTSIRLVRAFSSYFHLANLPSRCTGSPSVRPTVRPACRSWRQRGSANVLMLVTLRRWWRVSSCGPFSPRIPRR